jgi:hypothetical protein
MPNSTTYRQLHVETQQLLVTLRNVGQQTQDPISKAVISGGRLASTANERWSGGHDEARTAMAAADNLATEIQQRIAACEAYEALLRQYEENLRVHSMQMVGYNAQLNAHQTWQPPATQPGKPAPIVAPPPHPGSPPNAPSAPIPPAYWSAN